MRCDCCNVNLNDYESTAKHAETGEYLNTCTRCLAEIGIIPVEARDDLNPFDEITDDDFGDEEVDWSDLDWTERE